jgi:hypothetical protein
MRWQPFLVGPRMHTIVSRLCRADSDHPLMLGLGKFSDREAECSSSERTTSQRPTCGYRACPFFCVGLNAGLAERGLAVLAIRRIALLAAGCLFGDVVNRLLLTPEHNNAYALDTMNRWQ